MARIKVPTTVALNTIQYTNLKGADFSCDETECARNRTPDILNLISDNGGNPVKRLGWRTILDMDCGKIFSILYHDDIYVVAQNGIYKVTTVSTQLVAVTLTGGALFVFNDKVYCFAGGKYYELGDTATEVVGYVPTVSISRNPDGTGGASLEDVNLLTCKMKNTFLGDASSTVYRFTSEKVLHGSIVVEVMNADGKFEPCTDFTQPSATTINALDKNGELADFSVCDGYITFSAVHAPVVTGQDNVKIEFETFDTTVVDEVIQGQYKKARLDVLSTMICKTYGYTAMDRVFSVGGLNKNLIYYTGVNDPSYFPDKNYLQVGHEGNGIVGLHRVSEYLCAIKGDSTESTLYLIDGSTYYSATEQIMFFGVKPTIAGIGAISSKSFATLGDEPLFLSRTGVYAISNYYTTSEKILRNRSYFLDKKLTKEPNLENAVGIQWNRYYILCVNSHCYVLDGRQRANDRNNNTDFLYEGYYWDNVPATAFCTHDDELYFGTVDGKLCKFNTDVDGITAYCDNGVIDTEAATTVLKDGEVIPCKWVTPLDDDKQPQYFKTLNKKGNVLTLLPYDRSSADVSLSKDGGTPIQLGTVYMDIFNWNMIDFSRFTFNSNDTAQDAFLAKKVKKYKRLQIIVENKGLYEPFGIIGITKTFSYGNFSKNRG